MQNDNNPRKDHFLELRKRAEMWLSGSEKSPSPPLSIDETRRLIHELHTHQIELELQNEDLRLAQRELEESRRKYTDLYEFAPVGYLTIGDKGQIKKCNLTAAALLGVSKQQLLGRSFTACIPRQSQDVYSHFRKRLLVSSKKQRCELPLFREDGSVFYAQLESRIKLDLDGGTGQFRMTISDISDRKTLEDSFRQSMEDWEKTFDSISDCITVLDRDFRIVKANKATCEMFAVEPGSVTGRHCCEIFRGTDTTCQSCPGIRFFQDVSSHSQEIQNEKRGKIFQMTCSPVRHENGHATHIVHIARDITEQKELEAERLHTQKLEAIGTLAGGIAHDFSNILTAILGYANLVHSTMPVSNPSRDHLESIVKAGNRAKHLIGQILAFSRKDQKKPSQVELVPIVKEVLSLIRASIPSSIRIHEEIDPESVKVLANPSNIHQVLVNLCTNAVHAMENEQGVLTVKLHRVTLGNHQLIDTTGIDEGPFVKLVVSDTGCGREKRTQKRIFTPCITTKTQGSNSSLGLSAVHGIVKSSGGFITFESEPEHGNTFEVYLPIIGHREIATDQMPVATPHLKDKKILIINGDRSIVEMYRMHLESLGYTATCFTSSEEALKHFSASPHNVDLVIADQTLPGLAGEELVQQIQRIRQDIPVVLCTDHSDLLSDNTIAVHGVSRIMLKPVSWSELAVTVENFFVSACP